MPFNQPVEYWRNRILKQAGAKPRKKNAPRPPLPTPGVPRHVERPGMYTPTVKPGAAGSKGGGKPAGTVTPTQAEYNTAVSLAKQFLSIESGEYWRSEEAIQQGIQLMQYLNYLRQTNPQLYQELMQVPTIQKAVKAYQELEGTMSTIWSGAGVATPGGKPTPLAQAVFSRAGQAMSQAQAVETTVNQYVGLINEAINKGDLSTAQRYINELKAYVQSLGKTPGINQKALQQFEGELTQLENELHAAVIYRQEVQPLIAAYGKLATEVQNALAPPYQLGPQYARLTRNLAALNPGAYSFQSRLLGYESLLRNAEEVLNAVQGYLSQIQQLSPQFYQAIGGPQLLANVRAQLRAAQEEFALASQELTAWRSYQRVQPAIVAFTNTMQGIASLEQRYNELVNRINEMLAGGNYQLAMQYYGELRGVAAQLMSAFANAQQLIGTLNAQYPGWSNYIQFPPGYSLQTYVTAFQIGEQQLAQAFGLPYPATQGQLQALQRLLGVPTLYVPGLGSIQLPPSPVQGVPATTPEFVRLNATPFQVARLGMPPVIEVTNAQPITWGDVLNFVNRLWGSWLRQGMPGINPLAPFTMLGQELQEIGKLTGARWLTQSGVPSVLESIGSFGVGVAAGLGELALSLPQLASSFVIPTTYIAYNASRTFFGPWYPLTEFLRANLAAQEWVYKASTGAIQAINKYVQNLPGAGIWVSAPANSALAWVVRFSGMPYEVRSGRLYFKVSGGTIGEAVGYWLPTILMGVGAVGGALKGAGLAELGESAITELGETTLSERIGMAIASKAPWIGRVLGALGLETPEELVSTGEMLERIGAVANVIDPYALVGRAFGRASEVLGGAMSSWGARLTRLSASIPSPTPEELAGASFLRQFWLDITRGSEFFSVPAVLGTLGGALEVFGGWGQRVGRFLAEAFPFPWEFKPYIEVVPGVWVSLRAGQVNTLSRVPLVITEYTEGVTPARLTPVIAEVPQLRWYGYAVGVTAEVRPGVIENLVIPVPTIGRASPAEIMNYVGNVLVREFGPNVRVLSYSITPAYLARLIIPYGSETFETWVPVTLPALQAMRNLVRRIIATEIENPIVAQFVSKYMGITANPRLVNAIQTALYNAVYALAQKEVVNPEDITLAASMATRYVIEQAPGVVDRELARDIYQVFYTVLSNPRALSIIRSLRGVITLPIPQAPMIVRASAIPYFVGGGAYKGLFMYDISALLPGYFGLTPMRAGLVASPTGELLIPQPGIDLLNNPLVQRLTSIYKMSIPPGRLGEVLPEVTTWFTGMGYRWVGEGAAPALTKELAIGIPYETYVLWQRYLGAFPWSVSAGELRNIYETFIAPTALYPLKPAVGEVSGARLLSKLPIGEVGGEWALYGKWVITNWQPARSPLLLGGVALTDITQSARETLATGGFDIMRLAPTTFEMAVWGSLARGGFNALGVAMAGVATAAAPILGLLGNPKAAQGQYQLPQLPQQRFRIKQPPVPLQPNLSKFMPTTKPYLGPLIKIAWFGGGERVRLPTFITNIIYPPRPITRAVQRQSLVVKQLTRLQTPVPTLPMFYIPTVTVTTTATTTGGGGGGGGGVATPTTTQPTTPRAAPFFFLPWPWLPMQPGFRIAVWRQPRSVFREEIRWF